MPRVYLVVTIDTEADHQGKDIWQHSDPLTFRSVLEGLPERLHPCFQRHKVCPTYLLSYEVLTSPECVETLAALPDCELGTHLHGEFVPPQATQNCAGAISSEIACYYETDLERAKLETLTERFDNIFQKRPRSFRSGAYGADADTLVTLQALGYWVDTSITPHILWNHVGGRLDFRRAPEQPYFPSKDNLCRPGELQVLEVPITISVSRSHFPAQPQPLWLRPSTSSAGQMIRVIHEYLTRYRDAEIIVLNMMFHSMEVIPSASPYTPSESAAAEFLKRIDRVLTFCHERNVQFVTLSEVHSLWNKPHL